MLTIRFTFKLFLFSLIVSCALAQDVLAQTNNNLPQNNSNFFNQNAGNTGNLSNTNNSQQGFGSNSGFGSNRTQNNRSGRRLPRSSRGQQGNAVSPNGASAVGNTPAVRRAAPVPTRPKPASSGNAGGNATGVTVSGRDAANRIRVAPRKSNAQPIHFKASATMFLVSESPVVQTGKPFTVVVKLSNPKNLPYDSFGFQLQFNPNDLMPVQGKDEEGKWIPANAVQYLNETGVDGDGEKTEMILSDSSLQSRIRKNRIDGEKGTIDFSARVSKAGRSKSNTLAKVAFVPLRAVKKTSIEFEFGTLTTETPISTPLTYLRDGKDDQLGSSGNPMDGVVPLQVSAVDKLDAKAIAMASGNVDSMIVMELKPSQQVLDVGDIFDLYAEISNPSTLPLDRISLLVLYNPNVLKAIDADSTKSSVNLDVQEYKKEFPFDYPVVNRIDASKGVIEYDARALRTAVRGEGTFAKIQFKAIRPTKRTTFRILLSQSPNLPTTGVTYQGKDLLGDASDPSDGCLTTSIAVRATTAYIEDME